MAPKIDALSIQNIESAQNFVFIDSIFRKPETIDEIFLRKCLNL